MYTQCREKLELDEKNMFSSSSRLGLTVTRTSTFLHFVNKNYTGISKTQFWRNFNQFWVIYGRFDF